MNIINYTTRFVFFVIFSIPFVNAFGQNVNCKVLNKVLNDSVVRRKLYLNGINKTTVVIVDEKNYFNGCVIDSSFKKSVVFIRKSIVDEKKSDIDLGVTGISCKNGIYKIEIYQKYSQASGYLLLKRRNGVYIITKYFIGHF